ncbi:MAG: DUF4197 domain-containing protein [Rhodoferax sp.]|uniref:DUF4197 domain-containing protein n=1 Tax=Rhodoferax sp. TaxID=50421 RepID=UPI0027161FCC|nr:DUF4197 domain-containing protein [Rhodoferax sp.]MDO8448120.1 DUF4197 domain-containing protein [Rhodoferax sp.]
MDRRQFNSIPVPLLAAVILLAQQRAHALSIDDLSNAEASQGLKMALEKGALAAVSLLGKTDGFLGNDKVRIPLPGYLEDASKLLRAFGQGGRIDELVIAMNRAAEAAVPMAKDLLVGAVRSMNVTDAKKILVGGDTSVTSFFTEKTRSPLSVKFLPVVTKATAKVGLAEKYNQVAGRVADLGLVKKEDANIQQYVTGKSLDGLYFMIGEEEKKIRKDPVGTGSAVLKKVFGALN